MRNKFNFQFALINLTKTESGISLFRLSSNLQEENDFLSETSLKAIAIKQMSRIDNLMRLCSRNGKTNEEKQDYEA